MSNYRGVRLKKFTTGHYKKFWGVSPFAGGKSLSVLK